MGRASARPLGPAQTPARSGFGTVVAPADEGSSGLSQGGDSAGRAQPSVAGTGELGRTQGPRVRGEEGTGEKAGPEDGRQ